MAASKNVIISGLVQGVGFRPFIYRLASEFGFKGWVDNRPDGVYVHIEGDTHQIDAFVQAIREGKPQASSIFSIEVEDSETEGFTHFNIVKSRDDDRNNTITEVSPDIAVCEDCLHDMESQAHRIAYPFVNCTHCGPRFTIIRDLPYDREKTTMSEFPMCPTCRTEYNDIHDRRFHAQPVACNTCGPQYTLHEEERITGNIQDILSRISNLLQSHSVIAIKGMGGYNLMCDAADEVALAKLRKFKNRESKPFAVMFKSMAALQKYATTSPKEADLLRSWQRPIVIIESKGILPEAVSNGFPTIGAMLPYMPIHYLLFEHISTDALVMTSGNVSDEPILISDKEAHDAFSDGLDAILTYNREIHNRCDDSVVRVIDDSGVFIRRSRSYAPAPIRLNLQVEGIFAAGAELSNCFAIGKDKQAILSQHIGDLRNYETLEFYEETIGRFKRLFRFAPKLITADLHPDYLSSRYAESMNLPLMRFQHHHAHIASCMAENNEYGKVIGISFDGTGLGTDGKIWGSEFLVCDLATFENLAHFEYIPLPGGDKAVEQPWRTSLSYLIKYFGDDAVEQFFEQDHFRHIDRNEIEILIQGIKKGINAPESRSAGRLFDAVSALTGVCINPGFHAEAPMRLEAIASATRQYPYPYSTGPEISFRSMFEAIMQDLKSGTGKAVISRKFHETLALVCSETVDRISAVSGIRTVALSGGVFQNKLLTELITHSLKSRGYTVLSHRLVSPGDGGIALGQLALAAATLHH